MADLARIKRNVAKMASMNAPEEDIDGYIASEGVTIDDVRNFKVGSTAEKATEAPESAASKSLRDELSGKTGNIAKALFDEKPEWQKPIIAAQDIFNTGINGVSQGYADKGAALARSAVTGNSYDQELEGMRARTQASRDRSMSAGTFAELGGSIALPMGLASRGITMAGRFGAAGLSGLKGVAARAGLLGAEGGIYGGISASGNDTDISEGIATGAAFGAAIPAAAETAKGIARPFIDAIRARTNPSGYAAEKVSERLSDSMSPQQAAKRMESNPGSNLADVGGENLRNLLRSTVNMPGAARQSTNARLTMRQFGQGDRLKDAISKTFADPEAYSASKDMIEETAKREAAPAYRRAYEKPVHFSETLEGILATPAGKAALRHAETLAGNEQVPFKQLFVNITDDGGKVVRRVPDTRGWDYIKRSLDDMIDREQDSITKKYSNEGRILIGLKNKMLEEVDRLNPEYARARSIWSGSAELDRALEVGREVFTATPAAFRKRVADMGPRQRQAARVGAAETLRKEIDGAGMTNNAVLRIFSKRQQMRNLETLFETPEQFTEFRKSIFAEARKRATYEKVKGNSTSVQQAADLAEAGGMRETMQFGRDVATGGVANATLNFLGSCLRMLGGMTPEVAQEISMKVLQTGPNAAMKLAEELTAIQKVKASSTARSQAVQAAIARSLAVTAPPRILGQERRGPTEITVPVPMR